MKEVIITEQMTNWAKLEALTFSAPNTPVHELDREKRVMTNFICKAAVRYSMPTWSYKGRNFYTAANNWVYVKSSLCGRPPNDNYHFFWVESEYLREKKSVDYLMFSFTNNDFSKVWLAGYLSLGEFERRAKHIPANTIYERANKKTYQNRVAVLEIKVSELNKI